MVAALLLCAAGCTDGDRDPVGPGGAGNGVVTGTVTRHKTGDGVPNVIAALVSSSGVAATAHTDAAGRFEMTGIAPGTYTLQMAGHTIAGLDTRFEIMEPQSRDVTVDGSSPDFVFTVVGLVPPRITGEVFCGAAPVAGARIRVIGGDADVTVVTNEQGKFGALDLMPGYYAVIPVEAPCQLTPSYRAIQLRAGQSADADFSM